MSDPTDLRIGLGTDVHRLEEGRPCILGGIELDHPSGPMGHSDGDAVLHALTDAVTGAAGLDDIGTLFPDTDPEWKDADSRSLFIGAMTMVRDAGFELVSADVVIATEGPRIKPYREAMRASIAALARVEVGRVNVKGKTFEGLTEMSGGRAVQVQAVCLLRRG